MENNNYDSMFQKLSFREACVSCGKGGGASITVANRLQLFHRGRVSPVLLVWTIQAATDQLNNN